MKGRIRSISEHTRDELSDGWEVLSCPPNAIALPADLPDSGGAWTPAAVPSTLASALRAAGKYDLAGPPRDFDAEDAWYRRTIHVLREAAANAPVVLVFEGLATVADVYFNGELLFTSESMFVVHERRIDDLLRESGENELAIRFRALGPLLSMKRPRPRWRVPMITEQQLRWFRTTLLGRTPGWSPPVAAVGPFRSIRLERRRHFDVANVRLAPRLEVESSMGIVEITCHVEPLAGEPATRVELIVDHQGTEHRAALGHELDGVWKGRLEIAEAARWWPHTHGEPVLHRTRLSISGDAATLDVDLGSIGFRSIELDRSDDGFTLRVNGVRVFCRGACWTPLDPVSLGASTLETDAAIRQVRDLGMNMLRVGGTMVYETDAFLDACDREGILIWQDFMFANVDVPEGNAEFDRLVALEANQLLVRYQGRPSLAVLCGNSEGEQQAAMWGAPRNLWSPPLFHQTLPEIVHHLRPDVPYWPSSAHGGSFPHQPSAGTTSYYGVGAYLRPLDDARRSAVRFASECLAFANVPHASSLAKTPGGVSSRVHHATWKARSPRDLGAGWDFDDVRDHYLAELFAVDPAKLRYADHDRYLALSRAASAEVMARTFAEWRSKGSRTAGGLVWFLRDLWHGAGWGIIDAAGTPKAPFYALRRALAPIAVSISDEGQSGLYLHVVNDRASRLAGELELVLYRHGEVPIAQGKLLVEVAAHEAAALPAGALLDGFYDTSYAYRFGPPSHDLAVATLCDQTTGAVIAQATHLPLGLARSREADLGLVAEARPLPTQTNHDGTASSDGAFELVLRSRRFAQSVWLDLEGFTASDDHFHVLPGGEHRLVLQRSNPKASVPRGTVHPLNAESPTKITVVS